MANNDYTDEFKREAVELAFSDETPVEETAANLGVSTSSLYRWRRAFGVDGQQPSTPHTPQTDAQTEIRRLKKELRRVTQEREILKKAITCFARDM